jgi:hypothetical protein
MADLAGLLAVALLVGAVGVAVGMLVVGPRLTRWMDRDEEAGDGDD